MLYPETPPPYRAIFADVVSGIRAGRGASPLLTQAVPEPGDPLAVRAWLTAVEPAVVITLGRLATLSFEASGVALPQVIGALDVSPEARPQASGISLAVDPALLFATLRDVAPAIQRVYVVLHPQRDRWLRAQAEQAARAAGLTLSVGEATDRTQAAPQFWRMLGQADPAREALWLGIDNALLESEAVLPLIIEQSWQRRLVVFSSQLEHAQRGVLFALYPDHPALGRALAGLAKRVAAHPDRPLGVQPLRTVKRALNRRVAAHLRLPLSRDQEQRFDLLLEPRR